MDLQKYIEDFNEAGQSQDPLKMISVLQDFFKKIYNTGSTGAPDLLALYSTLQQVEIFGLDVTVIKKAIRAHVEAKSVILPANWKNTVIALNSLLKSDNMPPIPVA